MDHTVGSQWWAPHPLHVWACGTIIAVPSLDKNKVSVVTLTPADDAKEGYSQETSDEPWVAPVAQLLPYHPFDAIKMNDIGQLNDLNEATVLNVLKERFYNKQIYTYSGSALISINPFETLPLYSKDVIARYENQSIDNPKLAPHLFAIAEASFREMLKCGRSQSVVIGGESGSGKTEATKLVLRYLTQITQKSKPTTPAPATKKKEPFVQSQRRASAASASGVMEMKLMECNPLLEAFGNAKTVRNNNSSRFGKYIRVAFKGSEIVSAQILHYLLERSRLIHQASNERNFHIFYQLCVGAPDDLRARLNLGKKSEIHHRFRIMSQSKCVSVSGVDDAAEFEQTVRAMGLLGLDPQAQEIVFRLLAALLHMGNINFEPDGGNTDKAKITSDSESSFQLGCELMRMSPEELRKGLLSREIQGVGTDRGKSFLVVLDCAQAVETRDALLKVLFARLFDWLIAQVNVSLAQHASNTNTFIGLLDIFGFEHFEHNSFEQFCINYANEKVQQFYLSRMFKDEQKLYEEEKINWGHIKIDDNADRLLLIEGRPLGVMSLLNEECVFPKGTDASFVEKLTAAHKNNKLFKLITAGKQRGCFSISHYAGEVTYNSAGFLIKNKDTVSADLMKIVESGQARVEAKLRAILAMPDEHQVVQKQEEAFMAQNPAFLSHNTNKHNSIRHISPDVKAAYRPGAYAANTGATSKPSQNFISAKFKDQLNDLIEVIRSTNTWFVRCIKPCFQLIPNNYDPGLVMHQLLNAGVMDCVRIRKAGYPVRIPFREFLGAHRALWLDYDRTLLEPIHKLGELKVLCNAIITKNKVTSDLYQLGLSKVFLRDDGRKMLDEANKRLCQRFVVRIQMCWRRYQFKQRCRERKRIRVARAVRIQALWRGKRARAKFIVLLEQERKRKAEEAKRIAAEKLRQQQLAEEQKRLAAERAALEAERQRRLEEERRAEEAANESLRLQREEERRLQREEERRLEEERRIEEERRLQEERDAERAAQAAREAIRMTAKLDAEERAARQRQSSQQFLAPPGTPPDHTKFLGSGIVTTSPAIGSPRRVATHRRSSSNAIAIPRRTRPTKPRRQRQRHRALVDIIFQSQNSMLIGFIGGVLISMYIMNRIQAMIGFVTGY